VCRKWHPDRNSDNKEAAEDRFREVANAYEVLSDPQKRKSYDMFGEPGLQGGPGGAGSQGHGDASFQFQGGDPFNMFKEFFGNADPFTGMGAGGGQRTFKVHFSSSGDSSGGPFSGFQDVFGGGFGGFPGGEHRGGGEFQQQAKQGKAGALMTAWKHYM
jgi:curved DNA-binding protein CbpA